ncbi:MAG: hypothetical protein KDA84_20660, partial [Planctomycetaceae bacterium]|nr:hypothetical protein [Planctomycetaceae bacterium]
TPETVSVELIFAEYEARCQFRPPVQLSEFAERFPGQIETLEQRICEAKSSQDGNSVFLPNETLKPVDTDVSQTSSVPKSTQAYSQSLVLSEADLPALLRTRYKPIKKLGAGAMGQVFLAKDLQLNREVALKIPMLKG